MKHSDLTYFLCITVDGGAASGKSSTSRALANTFNFLHVDTGYHYRAVTDLLLKERVHKHAIASTLSNSILTTYIKDCTAHICINGYCPTISSLRRKEINDVVSIIASQPIVRKFLLEYQRSQYNLAKIHGFSGIIMEGRDIGSVIFPNADLHVFLEANLSVRVLRRSLEGIKDSIAKRDFIDASRKNAPLIVPKDAIRIDTSTLTLKEVVCSLSKIIMKLIIN